MDRKGKKHLKGTPHICYVEAACMNIRGRRSARGGPHGPKQRQQRCNVENR